jgi:hypothetical protein
VYIVGAMLLAKNILASNETHTTRLEAGVSGRQDCKKMICFILI